MTPMARMRSRAPFARGTSAPRLLGDTLRTIVVTSGKGGVGKSTVVANLAVSLVRLGTRIVVLDADYGLGNLGLRLGVDGDRTLEDLVRGRACLDEVLLDGPEGVRLLPASTGAQELTRLSHDQEWRLRSALLELAGSTDALLVDTATGISDNVVAWLAAASEILIVATPDPAAIVDAYAVLKLAARLGARKPLRLLVNAVSDERQAREVWARLEGVAREFLASDLELVGHVVRDPLVEESIRTRRPIVTLLETSPASRCFRRIASRLATRPASVLPAPQESDELEPVVR